MVPRCHDWKADLIVQDVVDNVNDMSKSNDYFLLANDFATYMKAQDEVDRIYRDQVLLPCASLARTAVRLHGLHSCKSTRPVCMLSHKGAQSSCAMTPAGGHALIRALPMAPAGGSACKAVSHVASDSDLCPCRMNGHAGPSCTLPPQASSRLTAASASMPARSGT